jgi:AraC family transcriptional regulator of adaptative response / DNA-3-methyladenine glycosylase II
VRLDDRSTPDAPAVVCEASLADIADVSTLVSRVRRLFDLDADSASIDDALSRDAALAPSVSAHPGIRLPGSIDAHETVFRTLVGQQISVPAARTMLGRVSAALTGDTGLFPTAEQFADHGRDILRGPANRVATIVRVAEAIVDGSLVIDVGMSAEELTASLTAIQGIGPWTAGYIAMRVLGSPDILLSSDLIMLRSAGALGLPSTTGALTAHGLRWAPWRSYAGLHLWRSIGR